MKGTPTSSIWFYAFKHCLGQRTPEVGMFCVLAVNHMDEISTAHLAAMHIAISTKRVREEFEQKTTTDMNQWTEFQKKIQAEILERGKKEKQNEGDQVRQL